MKLFEMSRMRVLAGLSPILEGTDDSFVKKVGNAMMDHAGSEIMDMSVGAMKKMIKGADLGLSAEEIKKAIAMISEIDDYIQDNI